MTDVVHGLLVMQTALTKVHRHVIHTYISFSRHIFHHVVLCRVTQVRWADGVVDNEMLGKPPFAPRRVSGEVDARFRPQEEQKVLYFHQAEVQPLRCGCFCWLSANVSADVPHSPPKAL